jgi:hypothetical protein
MAKSAKTLRMISGSPRKTAKSKTKAKKTLDNMDAKTLADVDKLVENIKNNIVTLLLVYADWCGHCGTFKNDIWKRLAGMKGRKLPMAQINEKVLGHLKEKIPDLKIDGYPTVSLIGKDLKAAEIKDPVSGETSNALPNTRDMESMAKLITANPSEVVANNGLSGDSAEIPDENKSVTPTEKSLVARKEAGRNAVNNMNNGMPNINVDSTPVNSPPDVEDDLIKSQGAPEEKSTPVTVGGSLYAALMSAARQIAVPAALTAAVSRRKRVRKGTKKH